MRHPLRASSAHAALARPAAAARRRQGGGEAHLHAVRRHLLALDVGDGRACDLATAAAHGTRRSGQGLGQQPRSPRHVVSQGTLHRDETTLMMQDVFPTNSRAGLPPSVSHPSAPGYLLGTHPSVAEFCSRGLALFTERKRTCALFTAVKKQERPVEEPPWRWTTSSWSSSRPRRDHG